MEVYLSNTVLLCKIKTMDLANRGNYCICHSDKENDLEANVLLPFPQYGFTSKINSAIYEFRHNFFFSEIWFRLENKSQITIIHLHK